MWEQKQAPFPDSIIGGEKNASSAGHVWGSVSSPSTHTGAPGTHQNALSLGLTATQNLPKIQLKQLRFEKHMLTLRDLRSLSLQSEITAKQFTWMDHISSAPTEILS